MSGGGAAAASVPPAGAGVLQSQCVGNPVGVRCSNLQPSCSPVPCAVPNSQPVKDVRVPGLQVDGKGALALATALVHVAGCGRPVREQ